ncbi:uncharacterized protein DNG_05551 [Cephalotrichum gorgonifer]|uniref:Uncharacterized protein n=1 Tax=Cephalotrichum gorgonifer TaxID=2041049 RepID=A0AAE8N0P7_9PEZI|nr:uncharacterized protein DNG_05551 [Cephalotrichum gorgonifer]
MAEQAEQPGDDNAPPPSPPLPAPHKAVTPGPRAAKLQELFETSLRHMLGKISWENLEGCYPTIATGAPAMLKGVRKTMVERLEGMCLKEFEKIMEKREVVPKLNELEDLVAEAIRRREASPNDHPTPPDLLPPQTVLQAHLSRPLTSTTSHLNAKLQNTQSENERLFAEVTAQRSEIEALVARLEMLSSDVDSANGLLGEVVDEIAREGRDREAQMEG